MTAASAFRRAAVAFGCLATLPALAQQLEPRAYSPSPVGANFVGVVYVNSSGDVVFDPSLPFSDVTANVNAAAAFYVRTFGLFGRSASVALTVPYVWGHVEGNVGEEFRRADRSGVGDSTLRLGVNLIGGPALSPREFAARKPVGTLGATLTVQAPTGQYYPSKLINIGTNRWSFKPELGLSKPIGKWWLEVYGGVWLFTTNTDFFGGQTRQQDPLYVAQGHVVYEFRPRMWLALDGTWYGGGATTVNGVANYDRQSTSRAGLTFSTPIGRGQSVKFGYGRGTSARIGSKLNTISVAWQYSWLSRPPTPGRS